MRVLVYNIAVYTYIKNGTRKFLASGWEMSQQYLYLLRTQIFLYFRVINTVSGYGIIYKRFNFDNF